MNEIRLQYKRETGNRPFDEGSIEIGVVQMRGLWVLDPEEINNNEVLQLFGRTGTLKILKPDEEYIEWLENKIENLNK